MAATKTKSASTSKPESKSQSDHARDLSAARPPASTDVVAVTAKGEWPVPPNTTSPPNPKVAGKDVTKLDTGLDDFSIEQVDGANAVLRLGKEERLVGQAALHSAAKKISKAIQNTY